MINALARLGWAHGDDEIFSRAQLVEWFDIAHVHPSPARFDADKLKWVNHEHLKRLSESELGRVLAPFLERAGLDTAAGPDPGAVGMLLRDRVPTLVEMADAAHYFYAEPGHFTNAAQKFAEQMTDAVRSALPDLAAAFETIDWTREAIGAAIKSSAATHGLKPPQVMMAVRTLVTGTPQTPAIDAVLALLGRERTIERLGRGLA
jgi:glutamyl-tRNA synthetase